MARVQDKLRLPEITPRQWTGLAFATLVILLYVYYNFAASPKYAGHLTKLLQGLVG